MKSARTSQDIYSTSKHHPLEQQDQTTGNCQDRISNLPDELLHHILSFLTTKTAISTSILAKRWRYLWTFVYNLNFDYWNDGLKHDSFIGFIDQSLANFPGKKICKFQLIFDIFDVAEEPSLDSEREWIYIAQTSACEWIDFAVSKGVEKLKLDFSSEFESEVEPFLLPKGVYNCCSVTKLKLTFCEIYQVYCKSIRWTALKKLYLKHVYLSSLAMKMILSRSKFLEDLIMIGCFCTGCAKVQSRSLKTLKLEDTLTGFGIFAPNLLSLDIYGHIRRTDVGELSFPSLVDVCLDLSPSFDDNWIWTEKLKKLYGYVCHAKNMKLCDWCIQMLSLLELNVVPAPLSKHSHLELKIELQLDLLGLGRLLKNSPDLETLIVRRGHSHYGSVYRSFHDVLRCWDALKGMNSPLHRLKFVSLYGFVYMGIEGDLDESDRHYIKREDDMKVIKFLLERAVALERLVIYLRKDWKREWSNGPEKAIPERPNASQITERLLAYPRASPHAEVLIVNEK